MHAHGQDLRLRAAYDQRSRKVGLIDHAVTTLRLDLAGPPEE